MLKNENPFPRYQSTKGGEDVLFHSFLTSALDERQCLTSRPGRFKPRK